MTAIHPLDIVVTGAGLTGLSAALLLARDGHRVTALERDPSLPPSSPEQAWELWNRSGVNQFRQPHLMLPRWRQEIERELPELLHELTEDGIERVNLLHLQQESVTGGWQPGDERFDTVGVRRPVLEASLSRLAQNQPGLTIRRGVKVLGLLAETGNREVPHVRGVQSSAGDLAADLVVDAGGRRTPMPQWLGRFGGPAPSETRDPCGFVYYSRHFQSSDGRMPASPGSALTHHSSWSVLTLPCDHGTYCVVLVTAATDMQSRILRNPRAWTAAAATSPAAGPWVKHGIPITGVMPIAGLEDVSRSYLRDGAPVVTGLVAVGDSAAATNPSLGRGATIGLLHACALRDTLAQTSRDPLQQVTMFAAATNREVTPWVDASIWFDRHRLGEIQADVAGLPYLTDDPAWSMSTTLMAGANHDPVLARASSTLAGLLAAPPQVFSEPEVQQRLAAYRGAPRYASDGPTREDLLTAVRASGTGLVPS